MRESKLPIRHEALLLVANPVVAKNVAIWIALSAPPTAHSDVYQTSKATDAVRRSSVARCWESDTDRIRRHAGLEGCGEGSRRLAGNRVVRANQSQAPVTRRAERSKLGLAAARTPGCGERQPSAQQALIFNLLASTALILRCPAKWQPNRREISRTGAASAMAGAGALVRMGRLSGW